jgi:hypothetical protein
MLYLMMVLNEYVEHLLAELERPIVELNMSVEHKYLWLNYYKEQLVMMIDQYMMDNNMMMMVLFELDIQNKDHYKNQIKMMMMNRVKDMMVDNNKMLVMNSMDPYLNLNILTRNLLNRKFNRRLSLFDI